VFGGWLKRPQWAGDTAGGGPALCSCPRWLPMSAKGVARGGADAATKAITEPFVQAASEDCGGTWFEAAIHPKGGGLDHGNGPPARAADGAQLAFPRSALAWLAEVAPADG